MALQNILGLLFPLGAAIAIGEFCGSSSAVDNSLISSSCRRLGHRPFLPWPYKGASSRQPRRQLYIGIPPRTRLRHKAIIEFHARRGRKVLHLPRIHETFPKSEGATLSPQISQAVRRQLAAIWDVLPILQNGRSLLICSDLRLSLIFRGSGLKCSSSSYLKPWWLLFTNN